MLNKVAVITGASRGLGRALAQQLGARGWHIVALARTVGGLEELDDSIQYSGGPPATLVPLDLTAGHEQLDRLGATLHERFGTINLFIHAAAMLGTLTPLAHADPNEFQRVLNVNAISAFRLLRSFDALLRAAPNAHTALIDCNLGDDTVSYWAPYRASKAMLRVMGQSYAKESGVPVLHPCPAAMDTKLHATAFPGGVPNLASADAEAVKIIDLLVR
jgi:NAD(P)-dependent dehydrogenase (short-subunit alcohol dehydrogenase family)